MSFSLGIAALAVFAIALRPRRLRVHRSATAAAGWVGVVTLLVQNLADLALEVPAVCIALAAVLGALWGDASREHGAPEAASERWPRWMRTAAAVAASLAALALVATASTVGRHDVTGDRAALHAALLGAPGTRAPAGVARAALRSMMVRHPAEPYFALAGGLLAFRERDDDPMRWLQRSIERAPVNGRAHLLLGEVLASRGARQQALLALRHAVRDDADLVHAAATLTARWARSLDEVLTATPEGAEGAPLLATIGGVLGVGSPLGAECDVEALGRVDTLVEPRAREALRRIDEIERDATRSRPDRGALLDAVLQCARILQDLEPSRSTGLTLRARLRAVEGAPGDGAAMLERECNHFEDRQACLRARIEVAAKAAAPEPLDAAAKDLLSAVCVDSSQCAETASWLGGVRARRGELGAALLLLARAARESPNDEQRWLTLAMNAAAAGAHGQALDALERVARLRGGADATLQKQIDTERSATWGPALSP